MLELGEFKQKKGETIEQYYDRLNELIFKCNRSGVTRSTMEFNLTFIMGLRKEWRNVSLMIKTQQSFDYFSLNDLYSVLKAHQFEVNEIAQAARISRVVLWLLGRRLLVERLKKKLQRRRIQKLKPR